MTLYIAHRINTVEQLRQVPVEFGIEVDLRDRGERLILQHDPFTDGEDFEDFLSYYRQRLIILNIKSERIEHRVLALLKQQGIESYFLLDSSFPMLVQLSPSDSRLAVRFSEFEGVDTVLAMKGRVQWVWVDCFSHLPIDRNIYYALKEQGFQLCLVSPELQGRPEDITVYRDFLAKEGIQFDAICTKLANIPKWRKTGA